MFYPLELIESHGRSSACGLNFDIVLFVGLWFFSASTVLRFMGGSVSSLVYIPHSTHSWVSLFFMGAKCAL